MRQSIFQIPTVKSIREVGSKDLEKFPLESYSYSTFSKFSTNPFMFKMNSINGEYLDTTTSASSLLGSACHKALQAYFGGADTPTPADEGEAIKFGHKAGLDYLDAFSEGFIEYTATIGDRAKLMERYAFSYFGYIKEFAQEEIQSTIMVEKMLKHRVEINGKVLPVPLKGRPDLVYRDKENRIKVRDHKFTSKYSDPDKIDAAKLVQAVFSYLLVYAETGEAPYSIIFAEYKTTENRDKSRQMKEFEIVFDETPLAFDLFFRFYQDITDALMGKQVFVPNFSAMFDNEVSILAYIHRLDVDEEKAKLFKEMKVDNITDFLKQKIMRTGSMKKYLEVVAQKFVSAKTLNYKDMNNQEKIKMKLAEHGLAVEFDSVIEGPSVTLYRFEPSTSLKMSKIEAYAQDIELAVQTSGVRVLAPIPNSGLIGFEVPNAVRTFPQGIPENQGFDLAIGETIMGEVRRFDIRLAPHMLVAGTTGSGKSVFLNTIIEQLMAIPNAELHLFDPKQVELFHFEGKPQVVEYLSDDIEIAKSLIKLVKEMEKRYTRMKERGVRNISDMPRMKYKIVVIDEFADLTSRGTTIAHSIQLLSQKGRAAGIHLIIATQRASTQIISGDIKINFPTRAVFKMAKAVDSRVMIDEDGAEKLLGRGDMLFVADRGTERLQGYFA